MAIATQTVKITNRLGMHARPATMFAEIAGQFEADITVAHGEHDPVDADADDGREIITQVLVTDVGHDHPDGIDAIRFHTDGTPADAHVLGLRFGG